MPAEVETAAQSKDRRVADVSKSHFFLVVFSSGKFEKVVLEIDRRPGGFFSKSKVTFLWFGCHTARSKQRLGWPLLAAM
jgi:hypothetical protein